MDTDSAHDRLSRFVYALNAAGVSNRKLYRAWCASNLSFLIETFEYPESEKRPSIRSLVQPHFHPTLPLIGLNYTQVAHNTLHAFPDGWTHPLRLCRGIVFELNGRLIAKPFPKFFNYGEHPETKQLPATERWHATAKMDGHLGICFAYQDQPIVTTRGSFDYETARIALEMRGTKAWIRKLPPGYTALVEIIHPQTRVHVNYGDAKKLILIGAYEKTSDLSYEDLRSLAEDIHLDVVESWTGDNIEALIDAMKDRTVTNKEGYVVRFSSGMRVKLKYETYIGLMVQSKLSPGYLMRRIMNGNAHNMIMTLPEEIIPMALELLKRIKNIRRLRQRTNETPHAFKRRCIDALFMLEEDPVKRTSAYRSTCGEFVRFLRT